MQWVLTMEPIIYFSYEQNVWMSKEGEAGEMYIIYREMLEEVRYPTQIVKGVDYDKGCVEIGSK